MSRAYDWTPLAGSDPVPGDPAEVAALGGELRRAADTISQQSAFLRSLCTGEYWDSEAGKAFRGRVEAASARLHRAHARYAAAADALGSGVTGPGYACALNDAQAMSARALTDAQGAWSSMRVQWAVITTEAPLSDPYGDGYTADAGISPQLDSSGNPVLMVYRAGDKPEVAAAKRRYNGWAQDLEEAILLLRWAVRDRDDAAQAAAARIMAVIEADGLQDPTGWAALWSDVQHALDDTGQYLESHWAQIVADTANVLGWIATALGLLALIFAFICPPLAAALEGLALTLTEICLVCHLVLAATGHGSWLEVGFDLLSVVTFGIGRSVIGGARFTEEIAETAGTSRLLARAGELVKGVDLTLSRGVSAADDALTAVDDAGDRAVIGTIHEAEEEVPGMLGRLGHEDIEAFNPITGIRDVWHGISEASWKQMFENKGFWKTIGSASRQTVTFRNPEISEAIEDLGKIPDITDVSRAAGIQFSTNIAHYSTLWRADQIGALSADIFDHFNQVTEYLGKKIPGYSWLEDRTTT